MSEKKYDKVFLTQSVKHNLDSSQLSVKNPPLLNLSSIFSNPKEDTSQLKPPRSISFTKTHKELIEENEIQYFLIRVADNNDIKVNLNQVEGFTILELKKFVFPKQYEENKNIRLVFKGKLMNDGDLLKKSRIENGGFVHAFIGEKIEKKSGSVTVTSVSNCDISRIGNVRGFERLKDFGVSDQEIVLQRYWFHSHYVMVEKEENIDLGNLINREEEWFGINIDHFSSLPENGQKWFKEFHFQEDLDGNEGRWYDFIFGIIIGFFIFLAVILMVYLKKGSVMFREGLLIGFMTKIIYISIYYFLISKFLWIV